jgi:hypothetical protein
VRVGCSGGAVVASLGLESQCEVEEIGSPA